MTRGYSDTKETSSGKADSEAISLIDKKNSSAYEIRNSDTPKCIRICEEVICESEELNYTPGKARALCNLGFCNIQVSNYELGMSNLKDALELFTTLNNEEGQAAVLYNFGIIFTRLGDYGQSLENQHKSLFIREKFGDKRGIGNCLFQIGFVHHQFKEYDIAIGHLIRGLQMFSEANDMNGVAAQQMILGMCYSDKGEKEEALEWMQRSLEVRKKIDDPRGKGVILMAMGNHYLKYNEPWLAQNYLKEGLEMAVTMGDKMAQTRLLRSLCDLYLTQELFEKSRTSANEGIELAKANNLKSVLPDLYLILAKVCEKENKYEEALDSYKNYMTAKEDVFNTDASIRIKHNDLLRKMESTSMEAEINRLRNVELKNAYDEIEQKNKDITASITYARRIQQSLLPSEKMVEKNISRLLKNL